MKIDEHDREKTFQLIQTIRKDLSESKSLSSILYDCRTVTRILGIEKENEWINLELNGYQGKYKTKGEWRKKGPKYRIVYWEFHTNYRVPIQFPHKVNETFSMHELESSIYELEKIKTGLKIISSSVIDILNDMIAKGTLVAEFGMGNIAYAIVHPNQIDKILAAVRNRVIDLLDKIEIDDKRKNKKLSSNTFNKLNVPILNKIQDRENDAIERKSTFRFDLKLQTANLQLEKSIAKTIAAFMNGDGGSLLIGVGDDGKILGLAKDYSLIKKQNSDAFEIELRQSLHKYLKDRIVDECIKIKFHKIQSEEICEVRINKSSRPIILHDDKDEFYVRHGNSSKPYSSKDFIDYCLRRFNKSQ